MQNSNKSIKYILAMLSFVLFLFPLSAIANIFDPPVTDKSIEYLGLVFGGNVGVLNLGLDTEVATTFLGDLFQLFNGIILAVAIFILSYVGFLSTVNTAQEGQVMGKKWSSVWIPLRSILGLLLLAPTPGTGYSFLQITIMWVVINGVGAADKVWNFVLDNMAAGVSATQSIQLNDNQKNDLLTNGRDLSKSLLTNLVCLEVVKQKTDTQALQGANLSYKFIDTQATGGDNPTITERLIFGSDNPNSNNNDARRDLCGSIEIIASLNTSDFDDLELSQPQKERLVNNIFQTKKQAITLMLNRLQGPAATIAKLTPDPEDNQIKNIPDFLSKQGGLIESVIIYYRTMAQLTTDLIHRLTGLITKTNYPREKQDNIQEFITEGQNFGWLTAGSFYYLFNQRAALNLLTTAKAPFSATYNFKEKAVAASLNHITATSLDPYTQIIDNNFNTFHNLPVPAIKDNKTLQEKLKANKAKSFDTKLDSLSKDIFGVLGDEQKEYLQEARTSLDEIKQATINSESNKHYFDKIPELVKNITTDIRKNLIDNEEQTDPLLAQATFGVSLMDFTEKIWVTMFLSPFIPKLADTIIAKNNNKNFAAIFTFVIGLAPAILAMVGILWTVGAGLAIYTPLVPFMMFMVTALSWFAMVIEAIVAAPIVALGLVSPAQDELGKVVPALGIIASIFLRPVLMIFGLILGAKLYKAALTMVNLGFDFSFAAIQHQTGTSMLSELVILVLYFGFIITLVNKCYALIYQLPDKILRWIGVTGEPTDMSTIKETQHAFDQAAKQIHGPAEGAAAKGAEKLKTSVEAGNKNKPPQEGAPVPGMSSAPTDNNTPAASTAPKNSSPPSSLGSSNNLAPRRNQGNTNSSDSE